MPTTMYMPDRKKSAAHQTPRMKPGRIRMPRRRCGGAVPWPASCVLVLDDSRHMLITCFSVR